MLISIIGPKEYMPLKKVTKIPVLPKESDKHRFPNWKILQFQLIGEIGPRIEKFQESMVDELAHKLFAARPMIINQPNKMVLKAKMSKILSERPVFELNLRILSDE